MATMSAVKIEEHAMSRQLTQCNEEAWLSLGRIAEMMGDDENTLLSYEKALSHNRMNPNTLYAIGCVYEKQENYTKAVDCYRSLVAIHDQNSEAWGRLGHCYLMINDLTSAHSAYQYAMHNNTMSQKDPNLWFGIGKLYERLGTLDHAEESYEAVLRFEPDFNTAFEVKLKLGIIAKQKGKWDIALERLKLVLGDCQTNDMSSDVWTQIGHVYEMRDEVKKLYLHKK